eukprot:GILK01003364.1.p1 GENE.GILK01003364.1~~GILK01003364.1.p1  ORF type:complete len:507 (-),score=59.97 GILK01003364.1:194-1618(-)
MSTSSENAIHLLTAPEDDVESGLKDTLILGSKSVDVALHSRSLRYRVRNRVNVVPLADIVGASVDFSRNICLVIHSFPLVSKCCSGPRRIRKDIRFICASQEEAMRWVDGFKCVLAGKAVTDPVPAPRRLKVLVNPAGGKGLARLRWRTAESIISLANVVCDVQETSHAKHAIEICQQLDVSQYDGVVTVSGDGLPFEVMNGLMNRPDWAQAVKLHLGVLPAGSGDGMCKSVLHSSGEPHNVESAAYVIAKASDPDYHQPLDIAGMMTPHQNFYSILSTSWGLISDLDIESERWRCLGNARFTVGALVAIYRGRLYHGQLHYLPASDPSPSTVLGGDSGPQMALLPELNAPLPSNWLTVDGPFVYVWICNVPWLSLDAHAAPRAHFCDGAADMVVIRGPIGRCKLAKLMIALETGEHIDDDKSVLYLKAKAWRLEPASSIGHLALDGEDAPVTAVQSQVFAGLGTIMSKYSAPR